MPSVKTTAVTTLRACLLLLIGGFAAQYNRLPLDSDHCKALFVAAATILFIRRLRLLAFFVLGFGLFMLSGMAVVEARLAPVYAGDSLLTTVRIVDFPRRKGASISMLIAPLADPRVPPRVRVSWYEPPVSPKIGEIWQFELRLRRPRGSSNPGGFSIEDWMFRERLHASGYVVPGDRNVLQDPGSLSLVAGYRQRFVASASEQGGPAGPILAAIGVGARHLISADAWDRFRATGTSHLVAISGLHIGLAAAAGFALVALLAGMLRMRGNVLIFAAAVSFVLAAGYALVSGFAVPSQRALLMLALGSLAFARRRRPDPCRIVALAAVLVYIGNPLSILAPGFGLSFFAVVILLWHGHACPAPARFQRLRRLGSLQVTLLFGLMPATVLSFQRLSLAAPLVNLLAVPVFSLLIVPLVLASMLLQAAWHEAANLLLRAAALSIEAVDGLIAFFARLPLAEHSIAGLGGGATPVLCIVLLPALWVVLPRGWPGRGVAIVAVLALLLYEPRRPPEACFDTDVLDVGQGLAVLVQSRRTTLLFDTGRSWRGGGSAAEQVILPYLRYRGIRRLDYLVVSHGDNDHAGGVETLVRSIEVSRVIVSEPLPVLLGGADDCRAGKAWQDGGVRFRFLHPPAAAGLSGNDGSCVLLVSLGNIHLLLTGDIEATAEARVAERFPFPRANIVLVPHHGSLTSSDPAFVNRLRPDYAIVSASHGNRWGLPKETVARRWRQRGAAFMNTASSGAIGLRACVNQGVAVKREERRRRQRFWYD